MGDLVDFIIIVLFLSFVFWAFNLDRIDISHGITVASIFLRIVGIAVPLLYYSFFESSKMQATLGERLIGLRIYSKTYQRLSLWRAVGRYLSGTLSQLILVLLWLVGALVIGLGGFSVTVLYGAIVVACVVSFIWWLCTFYIRIFSHRQQTFRDFLSRTLVIVDAKR